MYLDPKALPSPPHLYLPEVSNSNLLLLSRERAGKAGDGHPDAGVRSDGHPDAGVRSEPLMASGHKKT